MGGVEPYTVFPIVAPFVALFCVDPKLLPDVQHKLNTYKGEMHSSIVIVNREGEESCCVCAKPYALHRSFGW